ncbi:MAG: TatD family hydrolase [Muribaculaceae bacterium]|nr:TatD family hydrolase [Muribaculaceae bacterium]
MKFVDTHTHLYDEGYENNGTDVVEKAIGAGVTHMILPGTSVEELPLMKALAARYPDNLSMLVGLHPTELTDNPDEALKVVERELADKSVHYVGVGEIGIDLYCADRSQLDRQMKAFDAQCRMALDHGLPIAIHCRDGLDETLEVLKGLPEVPAGVFHCFGGTPADVERIRAVGDFYFAINGIVTFKNTGLRETLPHIGLDRILLETDAPYLAPVPYRGKRNDSSFIPLIAQQIATTLDVSVEEVAARTNANAYALFGVKPA